MVNPTKSGVKAVIASSSDTHSLEHRLNFDLHALEEAGNDIVTIFTVKDVPYILYRKREGRVHV